MRNVLLLQCADGGKRGEYRVAVVGAAAAVELVAANHRRPGIESLGPAGELGLFVEVAVEQYRIVAAAGYLDKNQGRASIDAQNFELHARHFVATAPVGSELHGALHVAVLLPVAVEGHRLVGDADVVLDRGQNGFVPVAVHKVLYALLVHSDLRGRGRSERPILTDWCRWSAV